jgi:hypothetical protein
MKTYFSLCAAALLFASCTSDDDITPIPDTNPQNELRLNDLRLGQSSQFVMFVGQCFPSSFEYTGDTLIVEVVALNGGLGIRESYTSASVNLAEMVPATYPVIPTESYLLLPQRGSSALFFFFGNDTLPVQKPSSINLHQGDCFVEYPSGDAFIGEEVGLISPFEIGELQYFDKHVVSCVPPMMLLDAYLVFDTKQLSVSMTISQGFMPNSINGYALISKYE